MKKNERTLYLHFLSFPIPVKKKEPRAKNKKEEKKHTGKKVEVQKVKKVV